MKGKILILLMASICFSLIHLQGVEPGESLTFTIKYGVIKAAEAKMEFTETTYKDSILCYQIRTTTRTNSFFDNFFRVRDKITSIIDKEKFLPYKFEKKLREGKYRQHRIHLYYPDLNLTYYLKYSNKKKEFKEIRMDIPDNTQDMLSSFFWVRDQDFQVRDSLLVNVTVDGRNTVTKVICHRIETIKSIFGKKECLVIEPIMQTEGVFKQTGRVLIWLTNDEFKIPLKLESKIIFGKFKAILKKAKNLPENFDR